MLEKNLVINCLLISIGVNEMISTFITVGKYPDYYKYGINLPTCGLQRVPEIVEISFTEKCFHHKYENIKVFETKDTLQRRDASDIVKRIFNGSDAEPDETPWTVHLDIFEKYNWNKLKVIRKFSSCSGVLIALNWLLTAAHCLNMSGSKSKELWIEVNAGSHQIKGRQTSVATNLTVFIHPSYTVRGSDERDVALIKLNNSFKQFDNRYGKYLINTICLPGIAQVNLVKEMAYSYGFGYFKLDEQPKYLQKMTVILKPYRECEDFFCSEISGHQPRPCSGDSGGPLVQFFGKKAKKAVLIGTLEGIDPEKGSKSYECDADPHSIKIFRWITVPKIVNWILSTIRNN